MTHKAEWYYVAGVRYCSVCRTRRCVRQKYGWIPCVPIDQMAAEHRPNREKVKKEREGK